MQRRLIVSSTRSKAASHSMALGKPAKEDIDEPLEMEILENTDAIVDVSDRSLMSP